MVVAGVLEVTFRVYLYRGHRAVALLEAVGYGEGDGAVSGQQRGRRACRCFRGYWVQRVMRAAGCPGKGRVEDRGCV
jgi:hypothetical protein